MSFVGILMKFGAFWRGWNPLQNAPNFIKITLKLTVLRHFSKFNKIWCCENFQSPQAPGIVSLSTEDKESVLLKIWNQRVQKLSQKHTFWCANSHQNLSKTARVTVANIDWRKYEVGWWPNIKKSRWVTGWFLDKSECTLHFCQETTQLAT